MLQSAKMPLGRRAAEPCTTDDYPFYYEPEQYNVFWDVRKGLIPIVGAAREAGALRRADHKHTLLCERQTIRRWHSQCCESCCECFSCNPACLARWQLLYCDEPPTLLLITCHPGQLCTCALQARRC